MPKKLTEQENEEKDDYMSNELVEDKSFIERIENSKDFKNTDKRSKALLKELEKWQREVEKGNKTKKGGSVLTMDDVNKITRFDREYNSDPVIIQGIADGTHHPLDGHELALDYGVDNGDE